MDPTRLAIIFGMGLVTYLIRVVPQICFVGKSFPEALDRYLRYLAYALMTSIISTSLFMAGPRFEGALAPQRAVALVAAVIVASWFKSPLLGMLTGLLLSVGFPYL